MTIAAPPQPPPVRESTQRDPTEALVREARERARRRRRIYGGAAAAVIAVAAVAGLSTLPGSPSAPHRAARNVPTPPTPLGAPLVEGPDAASTLLTSWSGPPGYVFVYADARVIWGYREIAASHRVLQQQRRLSHYGLELVRVGKLTAADLMLGSHLLLPDMQEKVWADPTAVPYEAPEYAVFVPDQIPPGPAGEHDFDFEFDLVPEPAKVLLIGKQRTYYDPGIGFRTPGVPPERLMEGFEVTAAEASELRQRVGEALTLRAIYPHGQPVIGFGRG